MDCIKISVKGVVQGVGFRPFIYNLADELSIKGFITNASEGVVITAEGKNLGIFIERISADAPPLSKIESIDISPGEFRGYPDFTIRGSADTGSFTLVSPDISVCNDCLKELFDKGDRRYLYPFINCTNCGPRYSITRSVPYDRANTTMHIFEMCSACEAEYRDPGNRRFHAQPNACAKCGPHLELIIQDSKFKNNTDEAPVEKAIGLLEAGKVIAIKGLGGFHLSCDAGNREAVERLRERKRRNNKPFALMAPDIPAIKKFCHVSKEEGDLLVSRNRPIVLLRKREDISLPEALSPKNRHLGFMLPYTPAHFLLFYYSAGAGFPSAVSHFSALVMTSGNISEEPIVIDNNEAFSKLSEIADAFLVHNRDIFMRVDDSVIKFRSDEEISWASKPYSQKCFIRRSRGYAPDPIPLSDDGPDVLGCGADLKNTFTLTKGRYAIPSQHIGDMENYETLKFYEETLNNLKAVYRAEPIAIAYDLHPDYLSTKWALGQLQNSSFKIQACGIQHHYAHIASVMAEKGLKEKVLGVAFDGNGYGEDGTLWGGEFLVADITGFKRAGHLEYIPLPGGEMAIREPWRVAVSYLKKAFGEEIWDYIRPAGLVEKYGEEKIGNIIDIAGKKDFSPLSSGAGRLFDAVSALAGVCDLNTFEGEAATALEALVMEDIEEDYPVNIIFKDPMEIDFSTAFLSILKDMERGTDKRILSTRFHNTVASAVVRVVLKLSSINNIRKVILSGGVFQNLFLTGKVINNLRAEGLEVYINELVSCNDGGISLGQAYILRERIMAGIKV